GQGTHSARQVTKQPRKKQLGTAQAPLSKPALQDNPRQSAGSGMSCGERDCRAEGGTKDVALWNFQMVEQGKEIAYQMGMAVFPHSRAITRSNGKVIQNAAEFPRQPVRQHLKRKTAVG